MRKIGKREFDIFLAKIMAAIFDFRERKKFVPREWYFRAPSLNAASISKSNIAAWLNDRKLLNVHSPC